jgi:hypothetical protein
MNLAFSVHRPLLFSVAFLICHPILSLGSEEPEISVAISALALDQKIEGLKFMSGNDIQEFDIFTGARSRVFNYQGPENLTFFRELNAGDNGEEIIRQTLGSVLLNQQYSRYLLFFLRQPDSNETYGIVALPDDVQTFRPGSFRFVNLSAHRVAIRVGDETRTLNQRDFSDIQGNFEHGNYYQALFVSLPEGQEPVLSYSGRIYFNKIMRMLYIVFPGDDDEAGAIRFRAIPDAVRNTN